MNQHFAPLSPTDLLGRRIAGRLSDTCTDLDHDITERLRVARLQAVAQRKLAERTIVTGTTLAGGAAVLQLGGNEAPGLWARLASILPLLALLGGLLTVYVVQNDNRANEVAEIDAALLTDDLPTAAYTDPGFLQFLKTGDTAPNN